MQALDTTSQPAILFLCPVPQGIPSRKSLIMNDIGIKREIIDLKMKDQSYNEIIAHFKDVHGIPVNKHDISDSILEAWPRVKHFNGCLDFRVKSRVCIIEVDEVFQGRLSCYIAVVDKESQYVFRIIHVRNRSRDAFEEVFKELAGQLDGLKVVITDGFSMYRTLVPEHFDDVYHTICHVHALRQFYREAEIYNIKARKAFKKLKEARGRVADAIKVRDAKQRHVRAWKARVTVCEQEMDAYRSRHGFKKWQRGVPWTRERVELRDQLSNARASLRSKKKTVENRKKKIEGIRVEIRSLEAEYKEKKQLAMQSGRIVSWFHEVLSKSPREFPPYHDDLVEKLWNSSYPIARTLLKYIKKHPGLKPIPGTGVDKMERGFHWSTNVESFFSTIRALLDKAKRFEDSETSKALLEILRLKHNMSRPRRGPFKHASPLERAGSSTRFDHYLDALYPPREGDEAGSAFACRLSYDSGNRPVLDDLLPISTRHLDRGIQLMHGLSTMKIKEKGGD
ncbi:MAG: hypothetical protein ACTSUE_03700 [Promethearchaeota archaeon]